MGEAYSPPRRARRGGVDATLRKYREASFIGAAGVVRSAKCSVELTLIEASPYRARASRPARQLLLSCRATLLCEEGNDLRPYVSVIPKSYMRLTILINDSNPSFGNLTSGCTRGDIPCNVHCRCVDGIGTSLAGGRPFRPQLHDSTVDHDISR